MHVTHLIQSPAMFNLYIWLTLHLQLVIHLARGACAIFGQRNASVLKDMAEKTVIAVSQWHYHDNYIILLLYTSRYMYI